MSPNETLDTVEANTIEANTLDSVDSTPVRFAPDNVGIYDYLYNEVEDPAGPVKLQLLGAHGLQGYLCQRRPALFRSGPNVYVSSQAAGLTKNEHKKLFAEARADYQRTISSLQGPEAAEARRNFAVFEELTSRKDAYKRTLFLGFPTFDSADPVGELTPDPVEGSRWVTALVVWIDPKGPGQRMVGREWLDAETAHYLTEFVGRGGEFIVFQPPARYADRVALTLDLANKQITSSIAERDQANDETAGNASGEDAAAAVPAAEGVGTSE